MKCQNSAKVNGFKRCIDEFVGLKQVKNRGEVYAGMGRKIAGKTKRKRELLRRMNHKMSIEEIADVLDMDVSEVKHIIEEQYDTED